MSDLSDARKKDAREEGKERSLAGKDSATPFFDVSSEEYSKEREKWFEKTEEAKLNAEVNKKSSEKDDE